MARSIAPIVALVAALAPGAARADASAGEAERLYAEGIDRLRAGSRLEACARFAASDALTPRATTRARLGECALADGRDADARRLLAEALGLVDALPPERRDAVRAYVASALADVDAREATLEVEVVACGGSPTSLAIDGEAARTTGARAARAALRVAPGPHALRASAEGCEPAAFALTLAVAERRELRVVLVPSRTETRVVREERSPRWLAPTLAGASAGAALAAAYFVWRSRDEVERSDAFCLGDGRCKPEGVGLRDDARTDRARAIALGAASLGLGVASFVVWPGPRVARGEDAGVALRVAPFAVEAAIAF